MTKFRLLRNLVDIRARRVSAMRMAMLFVCLAGILALVGVGLVRLQLRGAEPFRREATQNMACTVFDPSLRGDIRDRNGVLLATDNTDFRVLRIRRNCFWEEMKLPGGDPLKDVRPAQWSAMGEQGRRRVDAQRFQLISRFLAQRQDDPQVLVQPMPRRIYPQGPSVSHVLGYLGEISPSEISLYTHVGYGPGDRVGKSGVERAYEIALSGHRGRRDFLINAAGQYMSDRSVEYPTRGEDLTLTIDMRLQEAAYHAYLDNGKMGGAVFMDPRTGEVLAVVTNPSFSQAPGPDRLTPMNWAGLVLHEDHPLVNRAISSHLPLGSVFKLVVATAALEEGVATPHSIFHCPGFYSIPGRQSYPPKCYTSHGSIGFTHGIGASCDVVFYILGQKLGVTNINKYAKMMGLGNKTGIDLPGESVGLIPDEAWKKQFGGGRDWNAGDTINLSIGQGDVQITPVQVARMVSIFASGGVLQTPHVARRGDWPGQKLPLAPETINAVRAGMRDAVLNGTCRRISDFPMPVAAKTGTAQTGTRKNPKPDHAWFAGFAPFDDPVIAWAVYVEHGGFGASAALPVARQVLDKAYELGYFGPPDESYVAAHSGR
jgi:penicillin-binding protein 2